MSTNAFGQLLSREQPLGFHNSLLRVYPLRLDWVEPRTFRWQKKRQNAHPFALLLDLLVMLSDPGPHLLAVMPGGIIPDQEPASLALLLQSSADPLQKLGSDGADRTPIHKTQRHLMAHRSSDRTVLPKHPIAGKGFWIRIILLPGLFHQVNRFVFALPDIERGQSEAAPPHPSKKPMAQPGCVLAQAISRSRAFFLTDSKVQVLRSLPKSRGLRCNNSFNCWAPSSVKAVRSRWGREDPSHSTPSPSALKLWITLRTVWSSQPNWRAMRGARSPRAEASKIWQRRNTKALGERNPAWIWRCSSSVTDRIKMGGFMPSSVPHCLPPLVGMH